ncbi:hypothetical protein NON08_03290 [Cetobacterium somerae]|uniref:hypothetical protein n=1 Tax=Cetobacterium sp. NK01 TaxID=2993530 RepID=UPI002116A5C4|nr:hypothetical protein [Cetobacterium sp. NK01]MCQ8211586.1 hypothetical protein [Cetobacterium sp. NK01]
MFYFIYGDIPLPLKYEELLEKIKKSNPNIPTKIYDASQGEEENFLESISINSMFASKELLVLKRAEKYKKLDQLLKIIGDYDLGKKEIIITYEEELNDFGKAFNEVGKKVLTNAEKLGKIIVARKSMEKKGVQFFIEKELEVSEYEAEKLAEVLGDDFFKVKNEVEKIKNFLGGKNFILEQVLPILSISDEYNLKKLVEEFLNSDNKGVLLEYLKKTKEYMLFLYLVSEELNLILKLISLKKIGELGENMSYNDFKANVYEKIKRYFKNNRGFIREYPIFLKLKYASLFNELFLLEKIEDLLEVEFLIKNGGIEESIGIEKFIIEFKRG